MDSLWTFEMMTLCLSHIENEKCGLKTYVLCISISKLYIYWKNILEDTLKIFQYIYIYIYFIFKNLICYDLCHFFTNDIPFHIEIFKFF
jgi:hypothetical protein